MDGVFVMLYKENVKYTISFVQDTEETSFGLGLHFFL